MKKNIRKIPEGIKLRLKKIDNRYVIAACGRLFSDAEIAAGKMNHLNISFLDNKLQIPDSVMPTAESGKYSEWNINGREIIRRDLPIETHYNAVESPNWGDESNGTHTVDLPYQAYPRDEIAPGLRRIRLKAAPSSGQSGRKLLVFEVDRVLDQEDPKFKEKLLEDLNLLQENVGACGIQKSNASINDYLRGIHVSWEVLPPGTKDEVVARIFQKHNPSPEEKRSVEERYDFLMSLKPQSLIFGTSGFERYFGALLSRNLVVFENVAYGNAIYIMFDDWKKLSQLTRIQLLSGRYGRDFERVIHASGWKGKVREVVARKQGGND